MSFLEKNKPDFAVLSVALSCCLENYFRHPIIAEIKKEIDDAAQYLNKMLRLIKGDPKVSNDCSLVDKCRAHFERQNKERFYWAGI